MKTSSVLVTGAGGFLGSHLAEQYLKLGYRVVGVDNFSTGMRANLTYLAGLPGAKENLSFIEADVVQPWEGWLAKLPKETLQGLKYVLHFASPASPPLYQNLMLETMWVNSLGLDRALNVADQYGARLVFASTSEVYGDPEVHPQPETYRGSVNTVGVRSCYDESKRFGESLVFSHNHQKKTRHGMVRIFNTYGPRMNPVDGRVIINFLLQAQKGEALTVYGDGKQSRSFCYVDDLVAGIMAYAEKDITEPVNIGSEYEFTVLELAKNIQELYANKKLKITHAELPQDDPKVRRPNLTKAKTLLKPWSPKVPLSEGIRKTADWLTSVRRTSP